jgi:hypothetical protein
MDKVVLLGVIFLKLKCVCKTQMMPPPDHKKLHMYKQVKSSLTLYDVLSYSTCIQIVPLIFHS